MPDLGLKSFDKLYPLLIKKYQDLIIDQNADEKDKLNQIIQKLNALGKLSNDVVRDWNTVYQWTMNDGLSTDLTNAINSGKFNTILTTIYNSELGDLTTLQTVDKSNLVAAINDNVSSLAQIVTNVKSYGAKGDGTTDDTTAIQNAINAVKTNGGGTVYFPSGTYKISSELRIDTHYINLKGCGVSSKIVTTNTSGAACINISPPDTTPIPFFTSISDLWIQGSYQNGHGVYVAYAYNVTLKDLYINANGQSGVYGLHAMNCSMVRVRSDENDKGFTLNQVDTSHRSTTWTIDSCYFGSNNTGGGVLNGGDSNVLIKCLFEGNLGTGLYITNAETSPYLHSCYFETNTNYSINIDSTGQGTIFGCRFADENVQAHINLADSTGWGIIGIWCASNSTGTGININKSYSGGIDVVMVSSLGGATPLGGNAGNIKILQNDGFMDRFKISTNDDIKLNVAGKAIIFTTPDGTSTNNVSVDNSSRLTIDNNSIGRYVSTTPVSAIASGVSGDWSADSGYLYICHATNTWKRVAIAAW